MTQLVYVPSYAEIAVLAAFLLFMTGLLTHLTKKKK